MKIKLHTIAASLLMGFVCTSAVAQDAVLNGAFKTIKDVTITQVVGHDMVINGLQMTSGSACTLAQPTVGANWGGDTLMLASSTGGLVADANYGATTGATCSTGTSVPGVYEIDGASGTDVTVTVTGASAGGLGFVAAGCATDYDGLADGDVCAPLADSASVVITLAAIGDETVSAGNGQPVAGKSRVAVGGVVTSTIGLTAATAYIIPFDITVTY